MKIDTATIDLLRPWFPNMDLERITLVHSGPVCWVVRNVLRQGAMTIAPYVFYGRDRFDPTRLGSVALLAHELQHAVQYQRFGHLGFLVRYQLALGRRGFRYSRDLPLEAECYALQAQVTATLRPRFPSPPPTA